ncbi:autotransporter assembly complex protein TamA [Leptothrix discophora]|uniref:Translocation and assembly module subunit TamA n=1 Tax=Leptothrix discophora TaxID=89 RepID=A0ABT9G6M9_LEPDI|nr:BamA/TamA family outer membrane protein [Leptothrix discophora]MDP4302066.1 BamA/TamA family outer membrane protein [Leptothrix discophora]
MSRATLRSAARLSWLLVTLGSGLLAAPLAPAQVVALETDPGPVPLDGDTPGDAAGTADAADVAVEDALIAEERAREQRYVTWQLDIRGVDAAQAALLRRHLDLARYESLAEAERITRIELIRLLAAAPAQARKLLETEGYFNARVSTRIDETDGTAPVAGDKPLALKVGLDIEPGARTEVGEVRLEIQGPLAVDAEAGDADAVALVERLRSGWTLPQGSPYTQSAWAEAKAAVITSARAQAYAATQISGSVAQIDTAGQRADLFVVVDSGPRFRFGTLRFEGLDHVRPDAITALLNFETGEPLREQTLLDFQDRLVKSSLFDNVSVLYDPDPEQAGAMPVTVRVSEQSMQQATFGVGASDLSGPRITLEHLHQRIAGFGWQAKTKLQVGRSAQSLSLDLTSHPQPGPYRNLIGAALTRTDASGLRVTNERLRLGRTQDTERIERLYFVEWQRAMTRDLNSGLMTDDTKAGTVNYHWVWRDLDHPILPTRGFSLSAETAVGRSYASTDNGGFFSRATGRLTGYWPLGASWYGQGRVQLGQVFARDNVAVPFTLLFRAGGDDSVRGYGYQTLGPTDASGSATGGRVLGAGSIELARPFSRSTPAWWGAVFLDAGNAAERWSDHKNAYGAGFGVRWRSPVGPLRIDLAYGDLSRRWRLHFNVGVTF